MNDLDLLRQYKCEGSEDAFATLVDRHLKLVYATALRRVRSPQLAEDVTQLAFLSLARNAGSMKPHTILTAWLHRVTRHAAIDLMRAESRRQSREQTAFEIANMNSESTEWAQIEPVLDDALESLEEKDLTAVLLRYFENNTLREVGEALGTSEEAARKRVSRAIEQLRTVLSKRGIAVGTASLVGLLAAQATPSIPAGLGATILATAALRGVVVREAALMMATKSIAMTFFQKSLIATAIAVAVGAGIDDARRATRLREQAGAFRQEQDSVAGEIRQLEQERDDAVTRLDKPSDFAELLRLRGEVGRLRGELRQRAQIKATGAGNQYDATEAELKSWMDRVKRLKERLVQTPDQRIPEFQLLKDQDWLDAVRKLKQLETDADFRDALSALKTAARDEFTAFVQDAIGKYAQANNGQLPTDFSQLKTCLASSVDDSILQGYEFVQPGTVATKDVLQFDKDGNITYSRREVSLAVISNATDSESSLKQPLEAFTEANNGQHPTNLAQLLPYVQTSGEAAALQKLIQCATPQ